MLSKLPIKPLLIIALSCIVSITAHAQASYSITGATCATSGTQYQYTISGNWSSSQTMTWTISGGGTFSTGGTSTSGTPKPTVYVTWTGSGGTLSVTTNSVTVNGVTYPSGSGQTTVTLSTSVTGGTVTPSSQTITYGTTPSAINNSVTASGGNCSPSYTYQWQYATDNVTFYDISGQAGTSISFSSPLTTTTYYRRKVTETVSNTVAYSNTSTVNVQPQLSGSYISPSTQDIFTGTAPSSLTSSTASGGNCSGNYSYQWQYSTDGTTYYSTGTTVYSPYSPGALSQTMYYRRMVTCGTETAYSAVSVVNVHQHLAPGSISPASYNLNYNNSPGTLTATAATGGINATTTYQWQSSTNSGGTWSDVTGQTTLSYAPGSLTSFIWYRLKAVNGGETVYTNNVQITVYPQLQAGSVSPSSATINYNTGPGTLTSTGVSGGSGTYSYQWQSSPNGSTWTPITGATSSTYNPGNLTSTTYFNVMVTSNGASLPSASTLVTVYPQLVPGTLSPSLQTINYNTTPGTITVSGTSGGNGTYTYQWQTGTDDYNWTDITIHTSPTPGTFLIVTLLRASYP